MNTKASMTDRHGTVNGYNHDGCRCDACREAKNQYVRDRGFNRSDSKKERNRRWEQAHQGVCPGCGCGTYYKAIRCQACEINRLHQQSGSRRRQIAEMWAAGSTLREIAESLGSSANSVGTEMVRMRKAGYELTWRRRRKVAE